MAKHILQLDFPDSPNEGVFLVNDISIYHTLASGGSATCSNLQVTPPGFSVPTSLSISLNARLVLNACTMGVIGPTACVTSCPAIDDGMYNFRLSVAPNDTTYVEYKILRIVRALNRYYKMVCKVASTPCLPDQDVMAQLRDLDIIRNYLFSAKLTVENLHQFEDGMNLYAFAVQLMDKMSFEPKRC